MEIGNSGQGIDSEAFLQLSRMQPEERFEYALAKMIEQGQLWGLFGESGWLMLKADDDACLPIFPHPEFAKAWEKDDFPDCEPKAISLDEWMNNWLPGMQSNGTLVLVFPLSEDEEGIMLQANEVLQCIKDDMAKD